MSEDNLTESSSTDELAIRNSAKNRRRHRKNRGNALALSRARAENRELLKKAADLLDLISETDKSAAIKTLRAGLKASRRCYNGQKKKWYTEPDYRVRHESAMAILAYAFGKPIERQIVASGTFQELSEILARVSASPEAAAEMAELMPRHEPEPERS